MKTQSIATALRFIFCLILITASHLSAQEAPPQPHRFLVTTAGVIFEGDISGLENGRITVVTSTEQVTFSPTDIVAIVSTRAQAKQVAASAKNPSPPPTTAQSQAQTAEAAFLQGEIGPGDDKNAVFREDAIRARVLAKQYIEEKGAPKRIRELREAIGESMNRPEILLSPKTYRPYILLLQLIHASSGKEASMALLSRMRNHFTVITRPKTEKKNLTPEERATLGIEKDALQRMLLLVNALQSGEE